MEDTPLPELPVAVHVRRTSTWSVSTLGASPATSITTSSSCRTSGYDTTLELASDTDEDIGTEYALDINGDERDSDVKGYEFGFHMNANENE